MSETETSGKPKGKKSVVEEVQEKKETVKRAKKAYQKKIKELYADYGKLVLNIIKFGKKENSDDFVFVFCYAKGKKPGEDELKNIITLQDSLIQLTTKRKRGGKKSNKTGVTDI